MIWNGLDGFIKTIGFTVTKLMITDEVKVREIKSHEEWNSKPQDIKVHYHLRFCLLLAALLFIDA